MAPADYIIESMTLFTFVTQSSLDIGPLLALLEFHKSSCRESARLVFRLWFLLMSGTTKLHPSTLTGDP